MEKHFIQQNRLLLLILFVLFVFTDSYADWKLVKQLDATYATFVTKSGNLLLSDFRIEKDGGIYISKDEGKSWIKTNATDYNYNKFIEVDNHLFAIGYGANIACSSDEGNTWAEYSYADAVKDVISEDNMPYTVAYAAAYHNNKLYLADFCGGGIIYSEDFGKTWKNTDLASLKYTMKDDDGSSAENTENIYQLVSFKGKLYAFGVYFVFYLDETTNKWKTISDRSNFMAVSTIFNNTLLLGRSVPNDDFKTPFIVTLDDGEKWGRASKTLWTNGQQHKSHGKRCNQHIHRTPEGRLLLHPQQRHEVVQHKQRTSQHGIYHRAFPYSHTDFHNQRLHLRFHLRTAGRFKEERTVPIQQIRAAQPHSY